MFKVTTERVDPAHKAAFWNEQVCRQFVQLETVPLGGAPVHGAFKAYDFGAVSLNDFRTSNQRYRRTRRQVDVYGEEVFLLDIQLRGVNTMSQNGRQQRFEPGAFVLYDSLSPLRNDLVARSNDNRVLIVQFARPLLVERLGDIEDAVLCRFSTADELPGLFASHALRLLRDAERFDEAQRDGVGRFLIDLFADVCRQHLHGSVSHDPQILFARLTHFIDRNLTDPELNADLLAAVFGVSRRTVFREFRRNDMRLEPYVWTKRARKLADMLRQPAYDDISITELAFRCGYSDSAHCCRTFKKLFDQSPSGFRAQAAQCGTRH